MTNKTKRKNRVPVATMKLGFGGVPEPTKRFEGGDYYAIKRNPVSLKDSDSNYRRTLRLLATAECPLTNNVLVILFNSQNHRKVKSLSNRLSELYSFGLVDHFDTNRSGGTWALRPGIDVTDGEALYRIAVQNIAKLRGM